MGALSSLFGSKPKDYVIRPGEFGDLYRQESERNSPDVNSFWGSSSVDWDGDKATITQTMNPQLEGIANQLMGFVGGGPQQLGNYSNPFMQGLLSNVSDSLNRRYGMASPQMDMGGYSAAPNGLPTVQGPQQMAAPQMVPPQMMPQGGQASIAPQMFSPHYMAKVGG